LLLGLTLACACHPRPRHGVYVGGAPYVRLETHEDVHDKRHEWFQGLYRDCVERHFPNACFKTGQNIEDGVVAPPNREDAHWFYAKACDLQPDEVHCGAA